MNTKQSSMLASLHAAAAFLDAHSDVLGAVITTGTRRKLTAAIADLNGHASDQTGGEKRRRGATLGTERLRTALIRDHMTPIACIAHAELVQTPEIDPLRMPRGKPTNTKLVADAEGMAKCAAFHSAVFVDHGLPVDFIDRLITAAQALQTAVADRTTLRGGRVIATRSLKSKLSAGRKIVRVLNAYVKSELKDNPDILAGWNTVKRVSLAGTRPAATPQAPSTPTLVTT